MRPGDRAYVDELVRRELARLRNETDRALLELAGRLRDELTEEVDDITRRIDAVHTLALRELTKRANRRDTA